MQLARMTLDTPVGAMVALWGDPGLVVLTWAQRLPHVERHIQRHLDTYTLSEAPVLSELSGAVDAYFSGTIDALSQIPVRPPGTRFQRDVWDALREIPAGETCSYGDLARHIGRPTATRAVAQANGANPIPLVIPCHRVIASDGGLGGFSAGLDRKRWLLAHEGAWTDPAEPQRQTSLWPHRAVPAAVQP